MSCKKWRLSHHKIGWLLLLYISGSTQQAACLCNNCRLFHYLQVTPNLAWHRFTAPLLDDTFSNKIDRFTDSD